MEYRQTIVESFPTVFKASGKKSVTQNYGWFTIIDALANGDILKIEPITKLPLNLCLTKLSLDKEKQIEKDKESRTLKNKTR